MRKNTLYLMLGAFLFVVSNAANAANNVANSSETNVKIFVKPPSCTLSGVNNIDMGNLVVGTGKSVSQKIKFTIDCAAPVNTTIVPYINRGQIRPGSNNGEVLLFNNTTNAISDDVWISVRSGGGWFRFDTGTDSNCPGTDNRECEFTIYAGSEAGAQYGKYSGAIRLDLVYL